MVFSSRKLGIMHLHHVLTLERIRHVKIVRGDSQHVLQEAIAKFNDTDSESADVFLLHASTAAAGLTLTKARHVFLMEPFMSEGDELQAINRCHRIGQARQVECATYYVRGSVEERMLAHRRAEEVNSMGRRRARESLGGADGECLAQMGDTAGDAGVARTWGEEKMRYVLGLAGQEGRT